MPANMTSETPEWDPVAETYAKTSTPFCAAHGADVIAAIEDAASTTPGGPPVTILEVGCGTGAFALAYIRRYPRGVKGHRVVCTDVSEKMVSCARQAVEGALPAGEYETEFEFQVMDGATLEGVENDSVKIVVSLFCVFLIPDQQKVFDAIRRVLVKDGTGMFATTAWTSTPGTNTEQAGFGMNLDSAMALTFKVMQQKWEEGGNGDAPWEQWEDPDRARSIMEKEGFVDVRVLRSVHTASFANVETAWIFATRSTPLFDMDSMDAATLAAARKAFCEGLGVGDGDGPVFLLTAANVLTGRG